MSWLDLDTFCPKKFSYVQSFLIIEELSRGILIVGTSLLSELM
jgi:hypothetical protein